MLAVIQRAAKTLLSIIKMPRKKKEAEKEEKKEAELPEVGSTVQYHLALGEVREATVVRHGVELGTLDLSLELSEDDQRYLPSEERGKNPVLRSDCANGEEVGCWEA